MKFLKLCLLSVTALFTVAVNAQTADEIIAKHIEATGGKEKLGAINSVRMESTMNVMDNDAASTTIVLNGKGYRSESDFGGQKIIQVVTDKSGWAVNPFGGSSEPAALPEDQYKSGVSQIYIVPFLNYAARGEKAELLGKEKVGNIDTYKIKLTSKDNVASTYYVDPSTYYIVQNIRSADMGGQQVNVTSVYSDFKKLDYGWVTPQTTQVNFGDQFSMTSKIKKIEVNTPVDAAVFQMKK